MEVEPRTAALQDLRIQTFDTIRFASYRTACKLRYVQKATNLHLLDIWNVIEAFRENGLNTLEPTNEVSVARLETLISSLYHNLNKRLPTTQQIAVDSKAGLLLNWLLSAYTNDNSGIRVFSIKVALAIMCAGKLVDKLRYIFSQISDGAGQLIHWKGIDFLREVLALPAAVYESPTFYYDDGIENELFPIENKITVNDFIAAMVAEPGHASLVWLSLLHRLATVENIVHPIACSVCQRENFTGFRYRCQHSRCHSYQLCQECFWTGKISQNHQNDHEVKEYSCYKSPSKQIGHSLRKSFRCVPEKQTSGTPLPKFPDQPEKTLNLSHIVPPSPLPSHHNHSNGYNDGIFDRCSTLDSRATGRSLDSSMTNTGAEHGMRTFNSNDDPHTIMARYAARLAKEGKECTSSGLNESTTQKTQRELIAQLEAKNKEIMREIQKLRQQEQETTQESPQLVSELRALRQRKGELEGHLGALQDSRRQLMQQLEGLMKLLKNHQTQSPRSTPNSSPRSGKSPPIPQGPQVQQVARNGTQQNQQQSQQQALNQLHHLQQQPQQMNEGTLNMNNNKNIVGGVGNQSNNNVHNNQKMRENLHYAADSVSHAMTSLVRELNTESMFLDRNMMMRRQFRDFEETQVQQPKQQQHQQMAKGNGNWQEQFAQWNLNN